MVRTKISGNRYEELRRILQDRRREIMSEVIDRMRDVRTEGNGAVMQGVLDDVETSEADIQGEIEFALIQMKAETLTQIDNALARLEQEAYGYCFECGGEITEQRLRALPFAVRCKDCEELNEIAERRDHDMTQSHGEFSLKTFIESSN